VALEFKQEFINDVKPEIVNLINLHWEEIALNKDVIKLNPDWKSYYNLEDNNKLKIFTARYDNVLIGYFIVIIHVNLHYKDHLFASNDILYLHPDYRKGFAGIKLIKYAEKCIKEDGVSVMTINVKEHKSFGLVLERLNFNPIETVYSKVLIRGNDQ
tara:strand:- start:139 stop:609 length:471 start_codon:yes stop_codon:yes gene_type:complete